MFIINSNIPDFLGNLIPDSCDRYIQWSHLLVFNLSVRLDSFANAYFNAQ